MKNAINYYYNLFPDDIHQTSKMFYFDYAKMRYAFVLYEGDAAVLQDIYNYHLFLLKRSIYVHQIVLNKDGHIITLINGSPHILLQVYHYNEPITMDAILSFSNIVMNGNKLGQLERDDWGVLWSIKNDHLEYQISQLGQKHPIIRDSFSYYIGLGETSIQLASSLSKENITKTITHKRIKSDDTMFEFYNPLNLIIDSRVRDITEYFKNSFFGGNDITEELNFYLMYTRLSTTEYLLFLARMIYPTYYFDLYEDIISGNKKDEELQKIVSLADDYELIIKNIYKYYKSLFNMPLVEWLET